MENKDKLKAKINEFIDVTIEALDKMDKLSYFDIEIKVHQDIVDCKYGIKEKLRV